LHSFKKPEAYRHLRYRFSLTLFFYTLLTRKKKNAQIASRSPTHRDSDLQYPSTQPNSLHAVRTRKPLLSISISISIPIPITITMKSTTIVLASLLASVAIAQPHRHQHAARHQRRDETVVWVTDIDYVTETVDVTTTIWVSEGFVPPTATEASTTPSSVAASSSGVPVQFFQPDPTPAAASTTFSSVYVAPTPTTPVAVPPTTPSAEPVPTTTSTTPVVVAAPAPVETSSSSTPVAAPVVSVVAAAAPAAVEPTTSAAAAVATTAAPVKTSSSSSSSGSSSYGAETSGCKEGAACTGDITYYQAGLGACGINSDGDTENVVALPYELMGTQSNGNPYCGQTITIQCPSTGETTTATVVDKCMGCTGFSIDLSNAAFLDLTELAVGRTTANWWFN
jgi:hypothetical protein